MLRPGHWRQSGGDRPHLDAAFHGADMLAQIAAHAFMIVDRESTAAAGFCGNGNGLVSRVFASDMAASAFDALILVDERLEVEVHVEVVPVDRVLHGPATKI